MTAHKLPVHKKHHHVEKKQKSRSNPFTWVVSGILLFGLLFYAANYAISDNTMSKSDTTPAANPTEPPSPVSAEEEKKIEQWIAENGLNQYGDPTNTVYIGGTPLFNEATGKYRNLYDYMLERHPDRPWLQ